MNTDAGQHAQRANADRVPVHCMLDIGPAVHQRAGLSRYADRLATALSQLPSDDLALSLFYNQHSGHTLPPNLRQLPTFGLRAGQYAWRLSILASQLACVPYRPIERALQSAAKRGPADAAVVYHSTEHLLPRLNIPSVLTVHDLIFDRFPKYHTRANRLFLQFGIPLFVRNATRIIAVSQNTKRDLRARYGVPDERIHVVYEGIDSDFEPAHEREKCRIRDVYGGGKPYLLMVGSIEPRKNHAAAIQALGILARAGYPHHLLIAGAKGWLEQPILLHAHESAVSDRVVFLDFVPQEDLPGLYSAADVLLLPSRYEGFGFTALEAMACGTPVVCSDVGSLPEVTNGAAFLVQPDDIAGLAQCIRNILDQPRLAEIMIEKGLANSSKYRWDECARETVAVYREAAGLC